MRLFVLALSFCLISGAAMADCTNPAGKQGEIMFNTTYKVFQGCTGTEWKAFHGNGCTPPIFCPAIGDICDDGNSGNDPDPVFAGFVVYNDYSCEPFYVTQTNQSTSSQWKTSTGTNDINTDSNADGKINDSQIPNSTTFPAFKVCKDLTYGGYDDWYLPARNELDLLWQNKAKLPAFTGIINFWSSTEYATTISWMGYFGSNGISTQMKNSSYYVRCVRR